tara:strand:- start:3575 stop:4036 length:462 start_codon:yes stop_codon:yes gene_type:complete
MAYTYTSTSSVSTSSTATPTKNNQSSSIDRYSDLNLQMIVHPQKKDIVPLVGEQAVKNAIRTLLLTNFMERPFQPALGANLRSLLFEPNDAITRLALKDAVINVLERHEPRIQNVNVVIEVTNDENTYRIIVVFSIKENDSVQDIEINLRRLR